MRACTARLTQRVLRTPQFACQHTSQFSPPVQVFLFVQGSEAVVITHTLRIWCLVQLLRCRLILFPQLVLPNNVQLAIRPGEIEDRELCHVACAVALASLALALWCLSCNGHGVERLIRLVVGKL